VRPATKPLTSEVIYQGGPLHGLSVSRHKVFSGSESRAPPVRCSLGVPMAFPMTNEDRWRKARQRK
jgi:hypothetical protein